MQMSGNTYLLALRDKNFINAKLFKHESSSRKYKENQEFVMYIRNENLQNSEGGRTQRHILFRLVSSYYLP
jgi:hypothetical protein